MGNLLALDQASKTSGYAIFKNGKLETSGKFTAEDANIGERLVNIRNKILSLVKEYDIDEIVCEDIQHQSNVINNVITFKVLAEVLGVLQETFAEKKIKYTVVLAATWKSTLGIKGAGRTEQKQNAQAYVLSTYGLKVTQDESDAICIGTHHLIHSEDSINWE